MRICITCVVLNILTGTDDIFSQVLLTSSAVNVMIFLTGTEIFITGTECISQRY